MNQANAGVFTVKPDNIVFGPGVATVTVVIHRGGMVIKMTGELVDLPIQFQYEQSGDGPEIVSSSATLRLYHVTTKIEVPA